MAELEIVGTLERSVEALFGLMFEHHRSQVTELELTLPQVQMLRLLGDRPLLASDLAVGMGISAPAVSQLTDRMCARGLITRRTGEIDRRSVQIELTDQGRNIVDGLRQRRRRMFEDLLAALSQSERQRIDEALALLLGLLELRQEGGQKLKEATIESPDPAVVHASRTAKRETSASNDRGEQEVVNRPMVKNRMRIEWD